MNNEFFSKIRSEVKAQESKVIETPGKQEFVAKAVADVEMYLQPTHEIRVVQKYNQPRRTKRSDVEEAMEVMSRTIVLAMSEANLSSIDPIVFGTICSIGGYVPDGFEAYSKDFLPMHFFVLKRCNRAAVVHRMIDELYHKCEDTTIYVPYVQTSQIYLNVMEHRRAMDVKHLLFTEQEIYDISLPYVKEVRLETDGSTVYCVLEVSR